MVIVLISLIAFIPSQTQAQDTSDVDAVKQVEQTMGSDFGTFDFEKVRAWPRTVGRGIGAAFEMAVLLGRNSFPSPGRGWVD